MILYQYRRALNPKRLQYLKDLLCKGEMPFSRPSTFNDPFDCAPNVMPDAPVGELPHAVLAAMNQGHRAAIGAVHGIACFTLHADKMLMWSHYGDQHRSICVGFDADRLLSQAPKNDLGHPLYGQLMKVAYEDVRPDADNNHFYTTKSREWAYEDEYRLITTRQAGNPTWGPGVWCIPAEAIREVVLGAQMATPIQNNVVNMVRQNRPDVAIKKAVLHSHHFAIVIENLDEQPAVGRMHGHVRGACGTWIPFADE